jgi:3-methyladenine DNA glycosylase AlkD
VVVQIAVQLIRHFAKPLGRCVSCGNKEQRTQIKIKSYVSNNNYMEKASECINRIRNLLIESADELTKEKVLRLTSGVKCIGVSVPDIRQLAKNCKIEFSNLDFGIVCEIADQFFKAECREEILVVIFIIAQQKKDFSKIGWERISNWLKHIDNWETCDQLSSNVVTPIMVKNPELLKKLVELTKSGNKWERRFAAATVANINHGGRAYPKETFLICKPLLSDKETVVTKAVGWAIREISKKCPEETFDFLKENLQIIPQRLLKESSELLPEQARNEINKMKAC